MNEELRIPFLDYTLSAAIWQLAELWLPWYSSITGFTTLDATPYHTRQYTMVEQLHSR